MALLAIFALIIFNTSLNPDLAVAALGDDYFEGFEGSVFPAWGATGFWHIEDNDSSSWPLYDIPSDSHYAWYGNSTSGNYDTGVDWNSGDLTSDSIDLTGLIDPIELGFWSWAETENLEDIDKKEIFISPDGGSSWDQLGKIPDSDYEWQYWGFDITEYSNSDNVRIRFSFDTGDEIGNTYRGWMLDNITIGSPLPRYELFIMQDFQAAVGDIRPIDFLAKSYFEYSTDVSISIIMETPSGPTETLYEETFITLDAYETWDHNLQYEFTEPGSYRVIFILIDDTGTKWIVDCWWEIEGEPADEFILRIEQDYYAGITDNRKMGFFINSYFDISVNANISIIMETPSENITLFYEPYNMIEADGYWEEWFDYTFTETGVHFVHFIVIDEYGYKWVVICPWEIESDFFDLWIDQDYHAGVTDWRMMKFHTKSYYNHGVDVNISIDILTPSGPIINQYSEDLVHVNAFGYWDYALEYQFTEPGSYTIIFSIVDEYGMGWARECSWYIESDFFGTWIEQDMDAIVGDTRSMRFHTKNYFDHGMSVDIIAEIYTPWDTTELLIEDSVWIDAYKSWNDSVEYTFTETGEYGVFFRVIDENDDEWAVDCYWKVHEPGEKERFELKIDCDRSVNVGDDETMKFMVASYFNHGMDVKINATIKTPDGVVETLFTEMVWIDAYGTWAESIDYEFKEVGEYKVIMVLVDDIGAEWVEDESIDSEAETTEPTGTSSEESSPPTIGVTPGFESLLIIGTIAAIATYYRKRHMKS